MSLLQAIILGAIQGVTEFLPISSSGHLELLQHFFEIRTNDLTFDIFLHLCSLVAIFIFFLNRIKKITQKELALVLIASVPAFIVGIFYKLLLEYYSIPIKVVAMLLIITGVFNFLSDKKLKNKNGGELSISELSINKAFKIGLFQAFAILPGISRSGSTLFGGLSQNLNRQSAFEFSFFMAIPAILGAGLFELMQISSVDFSSITYQNFLIGGLIAFITSLLSLKLFSYIIAKASLKLFGWYCVVVGVFLTIFL